MDSIAVIVNTLAAGATALTLPNAEQAIRDSYEAMTEILSNCYANIDIAALERRPHSRAKRGSLAEDLKDFGATADNALLTNALILLDALIDTQLDQSTIGVDLAEIQAAALKIRDVASTGAGVRVEGVTLTGDAEVTEVETTGQVGLGLPAAVLSNVEAGRDVVVQVGANRPDERTALRAYLQFIADDCNLLPWRIVNPHFADPAPRGLPSANLTLADIYTDLDTTELRIGEERVEREEELRAFMARVHEVERVPAQELVDEADRLLIMGDPGSGKSTLVKHLAYTLATAQLSNDPATALAVLTPWSHGPRLPLRVELRQVAAFAQAQASTEAQPKVDQGDLRLFLGYLEAMLGDWGLDNAWPLLRKALQQDETPMMLLLDGLDEVATPQRQQIVDMVNDLVARHPGHRYAVTCRPYAYIGQPWRLHDFREATLAPFSPVQIDRFVVNWYAKLGQRERIDERRQQLLQDALRRPDLQELAQRPLLLTVMAQLHTFTGQLPDDRAQLYADAVNLLLQRWESRQEQEATLLEQLAVPGLKMSDVESALYDVAFQAHAGQADEQELGATADINEATLRGQLVPYLQGDWNKAGLFIDYIRERAGLLIRHKTDAYTFPHRTFQEYLAACHLVQDADYPTLAAELVQKDRDRWREVFLLSVGRAPLGQGLAAINALCPAEVQTDAAADAWAIAQLAGQALLEIGLIQATRQPVGPALQTRLQRWLVEAIAQDEVLPPTERALAGRILGRLGDPRPAVMTIEGMEICFVPAGPFVMGSRDDDPLAEDYEKPQHEVDIPYDYWIGRFPITNAQYAYFVDAGGYSNLDYWAEAAAHGWWEAGEVRRTVSVYNDGKQEWEYTEERSSQPYDRGEPWTLPNHPRVGLNWFEALAFCRWLTAHLHEKGWLLETQQVLLPSEAEWEKAARGGLQLLKQAEIRLACDLHSSTKVDFQDNDKPGRRYPWGNELHPNRLNYAATEINCTNAPSCFRQGDSPYGVSDMGGNVFEWMRSLWGRSAESPNFAYPYISQDGREELTADVYTSRILRGCSFAGHEQWVRASARDALDSHFAFDRSHIGFRCVLVPISR